MTLTGVTVLVTLPSGGGLRTGSRKKEQDGKPTLVRGLGEMSRQGNRWRRARQHREVVPKPAKIPAGRGTGKTHHLGSEGASCGFVTRMEVEGGEYLVQKRKFWRDIRRKSTISSISEEGNG